MFIKNLDKGTYFFLHILEKLNKPLIISNCNTSKTIKCFAIGSIFPVFKIENEWEMEVGVVVIQLWRGRGGVLNCIYNL